MKKHALLPVVFFAAMSVFATCRDDASDMEYIHKMEDTLFKAFPTMAGVTVHVHEHHDLTVVARSSQLYSTDVENKKKVTSEIGNIAQAVFGTNNELDKGQVIFTKNERSTDMNPPDGETYPIAFPEH